MKQSINLHKILNQIDKAYGRNRLYVKVSHMSGANIYMRVMYQEHAQVPEKYYETNNYKLHDLNDCKSYAMVRVDLQTTHPQLLSIPVHHTLGLYKDAIYSNHFTMPDIREREKFQKAVQACTEHPADFIIGRYQHIELGKKLTEQVNHMLFQDFDSQIRQTKEFLEKQTEPCEETHRQWHIKAQQLYDFTNLIDYFYLKNTK